jgi:hypothetical protein
MPYEGPSEAKASGSFRGRFDSGLILVRTYRQLDLVSIIFLLYVGVFDLSV